MKVLKLNTSKYELSQTKTYIDITYILASTVVNHNGALVTLEEMETAKDTIIHQPLIIVPDWDNLPTGHDISDEFPKLQWGAFIIGTHMKSEIVQDGDVHHLQATARVWKIRYPEIASNMMAIHEAGGLTFSFELRYENQTVEGATRTLHGIEFIGSAVVDDPANPFSYALEVASKRQKEEKPVNLEQAMKKLKELDADVYVKVSEELASLNKNVKTLNGEKDGLESASKILKDTIEKANKKVDELSSELDGMKKEKAQAELAQKQEARFNEISEFITHEETEIAEKKEAYGKMADDVWAIVLETAKRNKKEEKQSDVEFASSTKLEITEKKGFLDGLGE